MNDFDYQQWRNASAVTPEMLDSCLERIAELEAENLKLIEIARQRHNDWAACVVRAEQAEAERDAARRVIVAAIAQMSKETRACNEEGGAE